KGGRRNAASTTRARGRDLSARRGTGGDGGTSRRFRGIDACLRTGRDRVRQEGDLRASCAPVATPSRSAVPRSRAAARPPADHPASRGPTRHDGQVRISPSPPATLRPMLDRVITGGQTGADQAAPRAARGAGIATGGWAPKGWVTEGFRSRA